MIRLLENKILEIKLSSQRDDSSEWDNRIYTGTMEEVIHMLKHTNTTNSLQWASTLEGLL